MRAVKKMLNWAVRGYLRHVPVTEGKKQLLRWTRDLIRPEESVATFVTCHGFRMRANLRNPEHERMYFYGDHDERYEVRNLKRIIARGDVCWDIGANIGFYTCLFASLTGASGRVIAFEPASTTREYLLANIALNGLNHVMLVPKAVGAQPGSNPIYFGDAAAAEGTASLRQAVGRKSTEVVEVDTLDRLSAALPVPDFVKIDVEGYQMEVLAGGRAFFGLHSPMLMVELRDPDRDTMTRSEECLRSLGYEIYEFTKRSLRKCASVIASRKRNFFLVKRGSRYFERVRAICE